MFCLKFIQAEIVHFIYAKHVEVLCNHGNCQLNTDAQFLIFSFMLSSLPEFEVTKGSLIHSVGLYT